MVWRSSPGLTGSISSSHPLTRVLKHRGTASTENRLVIWVFSVFRILLIMVSMPL